MNTFVPFLNLLNINMLYSALFLRRETGRFSTRFYRFLYEVLMLFRRVFFLVFLKCDIFLFWYSFLSLFYVIINVLASNFSALYPLSLLFPFHQTSFSYILRASLNIVQKKLIKLLRGKFKHALSIFLSFFPSDIFFSFVPSFPHTKFRVFFLSFFPSLFFNLPFFLSFSFLSPWF